MATRLVQVQGSVQVNKLTVRELVELLSDFDRLWFDTTWGSAKQAMAARPGEVYRDVVVVME